MSTALVNGQSLYYRDSGGAGPVVAFSHGNLMDADMWDSVAGALPFRAITWDARLHGRTKDDGTGYTYWESAADLLGLLDHLGVPRAALVGHSQGGFVSLRAALLAPDRVSALVLSDTTSSAWPAEALAQMGGVRDGLRAGGPDAVTPALLDVLLGEPSLYPAWLAKWQAQPRERLAAAVQVLMDADDITGRLGEISAPALVVHGEHDAPIPLAAGEALAAGLSGSGRLVVVPGAGHTPALTHPDAFVPPVLEFLKAHARAE